MNIKKQQIFKWLQRPSKLKIIFHSSLSFRIFQRVLDFKIFYKLAGLEKKSVKLICALRIFFCSVQILWRQERSKD